MGSTTRAAFALTVTLALVGCTPSEPAQGAASEGAAAPEAEAARGPLEGVWSVVAVDPTDAPVVDPAQPGLLIFTESHYSSVYTPGAEARVKSAASFQPTDEEMLAQYQSIIVNSGTYEVDGDGLVFLPIIAKSPGFVGGYLSATFSVSGDTLVIRNEHLFDLEGAELPDFGEVLTLVRIE